MIEAVIKQHRTHGFAMGISKRLSVLDSPCYNDVGVITEGRLKSAQNSQLDSDVCRCPI